MINKILSSIYVSFQFMCYSICNLYLSDFPRYKCQDHLCTSIILKFDLTEITIVKSSRGESRFFITISI